MGAELERAHLEHFQRYDHQQRLLLFPHYRPFSPPHSHDMAIQIELEKERIRRGIIMSEIAIGRHILEAELRRELMMERELTLRQGNTRFSSGSALEMGFNSPMRLPLMSAGADERSLHESSGRERLNDKHKIAISEAPAVWIGTDDLRIVEVNPGTRQGKEKEKIVLQAKTDDHISGLKRKIETPDAIGSPPGNIVVKKAKREWFCDLCQVSVTSERGLSEHLQGRKHKAKEAASKVQSAGKNYCIGFCPKKAKKIVQVAKAANPNIEEGLKLTSESFPIEKDELPKVLEGLKPKKWKKTKLVSKIMPKRSVLEKKKKYKHWCEMCQVGAFSEDVMNAHIRGKKHVFWSQNANQNGPNQEEAAQVVKNTAPDNGKALDSASTEEDHDCKNKAEQGHELSGATEPEVQAVQF